MPNKPTIVLPLGSHYLTFEQYGGSASNEAILAIRKNNARNKPGQTVDGTTISKDRTGLIQTALHLLNIAADMPAPTTFADSQTIFAQGSEMPLKRQVSDKDLENIRLALSDSHDRLIKRMPILRSLQVLFEKTENQELVDTLEMLIMIARQNDSLPIKMTASPEAVPSQIN